MINFKYFAIFLLFLIMEISSLAQSKFGFSGNASVTYGGPIPEKISENSSGKPKIGYSLGIGISYKFNTKFEIQTFTNYSFKGVFYNTSYKKDTIIEQIINNNIHKLNSFYTAYVNGEMSFYYVDFFILPSFKISKKHTLQLGSYISYLAGGYDKGQVQVVIGQGGFFGDYFENYDNFSKIKKVDYGLVLGFQSALYGKIFSGFILNRSLSSLYRVDNFIRRGLEENKLYNTYVNLYLGYKIK